MLQIINKVFKTSIVKWVSDKHIMITDHWWLCKFFFVFTYRLYCIRLCQPNKIYLLTVSENGSTFISLFRLFWIFLRPLPYDAKCRQFGWDFISSEMFLMIDIKFNLIQFLIRHEHLIMVDIRRKYVALLPDVLLYSMHSDAFTQVFLNQYMSFVNVFHNIWKVFLLSC